MEHRLGRRIPNRQTARLETPAGVANAQIIDLSVSGAFMRTPHQLPTHALVRVRLRCTGAGSPPGAWRWVDARVVRSDILGVGVEWSDFAPAVVLDLVMEADGALASAPPVRQQVALRR
jgi:hypothetical protein